MLEYEKKQIKVGTKVISRSDNCLWRVTKQIDKTHYEVQRISQKGKTLIQTLSLDKASFRLPTNIYEFETTIRIKVCGVSEEDARKRLPTALYDENEYEYECNRYNCINTEYNA